MPGHVFDANVLKNILLSGRLSLLPELCPGQRYLPISVYNELLDTRRAFQRMLGRSPRDALVRINMLLQDLDAHLERAGLVRLNVLQSDNPDELEFYACLDEEDRIDPGETECIALAAYRDLTLYSDDLGAFREVLAINSDTADCLRDPSTMTLPLTTHGTIWLLIKAAQEGRLTLQKASDAYDFMRFELRSRLPRHPLGTIMADPSQYW